MMFLVWWVWKVFSVWLMVGWFEVSMVVVNSVVLDVLVLLMVKVVIGMLVGICMIDSSEFMLLRVLDCIGIFSIGMVVLVVIMFGRCVVLSVSVMIVCRFWGLVCLVQVNSMFGVWCVDIIFILQGIFSELSFWVVCCMVFQLEWEFMMMLMSGVVWLGVIGCYLF